MEPTTRSTAVDSLGRPEHGVSWGGGLAVRGISRGPDVPVSVGNPHQTGAPAVRVIGDFDGQKVSLDRGKPQTDENITVIPNLPAGEEFVTVLEF